MVAVRPAVRRSLRLVLPLVILVLAFAVWDNVEVRRFDRAAKPFQSTVPAGPAAPPDRDDASRYYAAAAIAAVGMPESAAAIYEALRQQREALSGQAAGAEQDLRRRATLMSHGDPSVRLIRLGGELPFAGFAPQVDFNYRFSGLSRAGGLAAVETLSLLQDGDVPGAAQSLISRIRFLRVFSAGYGITEYARQVRELATDVGFILSSPSLSDAAMQSVERELGVVDPGNDFRAIVDSTAAAEVMMPQAIRNLGRRYASTIIVVRPWILRSATRRLQTLAAVLPASRLPWPLRFEALQAMRDSPEATRLRLLAVDAASAVAALRCARVAVAIERQRRAGDETPPALDRLGLPQEETADPFTGERLHYERRGDGYAVFSTGFADGQNASRVSNVGVTVKTPR